MKYKVGDKVRIRAWKDMAREYGMNGGSIRIPQSFVPEMRKYCGKVMTIASNKYDCYAMKEDPDGWTFSKEMFEPVGKTPEFASGVTLYREDRKVIAIDRHTRNVGVAYCAPEDEFDFCTGAELALARLAGREKPAVLPPKYYSGEIVCIDATASFTVGKVYNVKDGKFYDDNGEVHGKPYPFISLDDINNNHFSKFAELKR